MYEVQKARAEAGRSELRATVADVIEAVFVAWPWTRAGRRDRTTVRQNQRAWLLPSWVLSIGELGRGPSSAARLEGGAEGAWLCNGQRQYGTDLTERNLRGRDSGVYV